METNDIIGLLVRTLVTTFVARFVLDMTTSWVTYEARNTVVANVLTGWCLAVASVAYAFGSGLGAIAAVVACIWHVAGVLRERSLAPANRPYPRA